MRTLFLAAAFLFAAPAYAQVDLDADGGFNERGVDRNDRSPDWNYRRGEAIGKGAYYDGGRYGPRGLLGGTAAPDPWLLNGGDAARALVAARGPSRANRWFAKLADRDRDARLTDAEIARALAIVAVRGRQYVAVSRR